VSRFGNQIRSGTAVSGWTKRSTSTSRVPDVMEYLVIAGGGAGAHDNGVYGGSGGGAGGYRSSIVGETSGGGASAENKALVISGATYTVTVGGGAQVYATNGSNSSIIGTAVSITSQGGGFGQTQGSAGAAGGSGGGGSSGGAGTSGQGYAGGAGNGSGGGGAAEAGNTDGAGQGGDGRSSSVTGSAVTRAGGGGLFGGGDGGGGGGSQDGTANTGGGGGGTFSMGSGNARKGGSGVVFIRIRNTEKSPTTLTVGTESIVGDYKVYTFNASGTIGWS